MLDQWRELPIMTGSPHALDMQALHEAVGTIVRTNMAVPEGHESLQGRTAVYGYDQLGECSPERQQIVVVRYRMRPGMTDRGLPLKTFEKGDRLELFASAHITKLDQTRRAPRMAGGRAWSRRTTITAPDEQLDWFMYNQSSWGIDVEKARILGSFPRFMFRDNRKTTLFETRISAIVTVVDTDLFTTMVTQGIGRAKGFGFGLVQYRPLV